MTGCYVHIPFCVRKCHYCNFVIALAGSRERHAAFLSALEKECERYRLRFERTAFDTLYLGGGTPSTLGIEEIKDLFHVLRKNFRFKKDTEVTCEANPDDVTAEKALAWKTLGVNRVSLGAQSFHDATLKALNRAHGAEEIFRAFSILRSAGFSNLNLDLILSLPGESLDEVQASLAQAVGLGPEHLSLYELTIEKKTVFGRRFEEGKLRLPDESVQQAMLSYARDFLKRNGFTHYELLNYAREGFESRHNLLYWANAEYLGLGPAAFSYFDGRRFRNSDSFEEYLSKIAAGDGSAHEEETLSPDKKDIESLLLALRLTEGADLKSFRPVLARLDESVDRLVQKGLLIQDAEKIKLSPRGQFFAETVFTELALPG